MIIVTRIMRTGGTSFWQGIRKNFRKGECWQKDKFERKKYKEIGGLVHALKYGKRFDIVPKVFMHHVPYGVHELFATDAYKYVTFLREPVSRTVSLLQYAYNLKYDASYADKLESQGYYEGQLFLQGYFRNNYRNVLKVLDLCIRNETCCNVMTKQLSGLENFDNVACNYSWKSGNLYCVNHTNKKPYTKDQMEEFLAAAKKNLATYFFIGFQENGSEDHRKVCDRLDWNYEGGMRHNASLSMKVDWGGAEIESYIKMMNGFDTQLYDYARLLRMKQDVGAKYYVPKLDSDSVVVSGGGFVGKWDEYIANHYDCNIFIFEPFPDNYNILKYKFADNPKVVVLRCALGNTDGERSLYVFEGKANSHSFFPRTDKKIVNVIKVPVMRLGTFISMNGLDVVDLLKLNVEGAEVEILESINGKLASKIKHISFSSHENKITSEEDHRVTLAHLEKIGYKVDRFTMQNKWKCVHEIATL